jgi:hypothetical protein
LQIGEKRVRLPLEIQVYMLSDNGIQVAFSVLGQIQGDEENDFLADLGFGTGYLQHLTRDQYYQIVKPIDLNKVLPNLLIMG